MWSAPSARPRTPKLRRFSRTISSTDASGRATELTLDAAGRTLLQHSTASGLPDVDASYTYDAAGRPLTVVDSGGTSTWTWDTAPALLPTDPAPTGRLLTRTDPNGTLTYSWTDAGRMAPRTVAPATGPPQTETYGYTAGRLTGRTGPGGTSTYSWTDGRLTASTHPAGSSVRTYDTAGRLETLTNDDGTNETSYELGYDTQGRVVTNTRTVDGDPLTAATTAWTYDAASQLTSETNSGATSAPDRTWTWTGGRLQSQTVGDETKDTGWVDGRMTQVAIAPSALPGDEELVSFTYDDAGRQTAWSSADVAVDRSFDAAGRLTDATRTDGSGTTTESRTYHGGQLVTASVDDGTTSQTHSLWWDDGDLAPHAATIVDPVAGPLTQLVGELAPGAPTWMLTELGPLAGGAGGPNAPPPQLTDPFGSDLAQVTGPFGGLDTPATAPIQATARGALAIGVSGVSLTAPGPLVHTGARDADSELFISPDPLAALAGTPDASNSYAAHGNSPTTVWDFSGLRPNYGDDGSRFGLLGTILQTASMVPGLDTFADSAMCALELGAAIGGNGNTASLVMSCAAVVLPAVGAGAMALTSRAYKGVTEIRKARKAVRVAEELLEEGVEHGDEAAGMLRRGGSYLDRLRSHRGAFGVAGDAPTESAESWAARRAGELQGSLPPGSQGRVTMGTAVVRDSTGSEIRAISTSEPGGYLRPGIALEPGEAVVSGTGHAEADIVAWANQNRYEVVTVGAGRPICGSCAAAIDGAGGTAATPLKGR